MSKSKALVFVTGFDNSDITKGVQEIKGEFGGLKSITELTAKEIKTAFNSAQKSIEKAQEQVREAEWQKIPLIDQAIELETKLEDAKSKLEELQKQQAGAKAALTLPTGRMPTGAEIEAYQNAKTQKPQLDAAVTEQRKQVEALQKEWARVDQQILNYDSKIGFASETIALQTANAEELADQMKKVQRQTAAEQAVAAQKAAWDKAFTTMKKAASGFGKTVSKVMSGAKKILGGVFSKAGKSASGFGSRLKSIISGAFVFNLISAGLRKVTDYLGNAISSSEEMKGAMANLKGAAANAAAPIVSALTPALAALANAAATVFSYLGKIVTFFTGKSASAASTATDQIKNTAGAAKKAMKSLAGFDEITKLDDKDSGGGSGGGGTDINYDFQGKSAFLDSVLQSVKDGDWEQVGTLFGEKINGVIDSINGVDLGTKLGTFVNNIVSVLHGFFTSTDFSNIGETAGETLTAAFSTIDWAKVGETISGAITALPSTIVGFIQGTDWSVVSAGLTEMFTNIDWENIKTILSEGFTGVLGMISGLASGFAPLQGIDFSAATTSLQGLWQAVWNLAETVAGVLTTAYETVLKPLLGWVIEDAAPASIGVFTAAFDALSAILEPVMEGLDGLMDGLEPVITFIEDTAMVALDGLKSIFEKVGQVFTEKGEKITNIISGIGEIISIVWKLIEPQMMYLKGLIGAVFGYIGDTISNTVGWIIDLFSGLIDFVVGVFTGDWDRAWEGLVGIFEGYVDTIKGAINALIGFINGMISAVVAGINSVIRALNRLKFTIPDWVPGLGGESFGFNLKTLTAPQIPLLAQGAVLPPNKPFLAMVGDQKHGTNIEAPLSTIQEAVAAVMGDQVSAMMAGFEALLEENRLLRQVVENIELGDTTIGQSANRYLQKLAVMRGGSL